MARVICIRSILRLCVAYVALESEHDGGLVVT